MDFMKFFKRIKHILAESGLAPDSLWVLRKTIENERLRSFCLRYLRLRFTPLILERFEKLGTEGSIGRLFSAAISLINVQETYKTTGWARTSLVDNAIVRFAESKKTFTMMEVGASDGSSCMNLASRLSNLEQLRLTDRHPEFYAIGSPGCTVLLDGDHRLLGIKILCFYINLSMQLKISRQGRTISTLNPTVRATTGAVSIEKFDIIKGILSPPVDAIKCSNLLNLSYFTSDEIIEAANNLGHSILEDGALFISQNNPRYQGGESYFILRKRKGRLTLEESVNNHDAAALFTN